MPRIPEDLENRLRSCRTLPSVPVVAIKIIELCKQEDIGIPEVSSVLSRDPALVAKMLRAANSAFYVVRSEVTTLERAISIMGINAALSLSLSFSLVGTLRKPHRPGFDYGVYWRRSVITAAAAKLLGTTPSRNSGEEHFLAGLLQDIGMLVLNEAMHDTYGDVVAAANGDHERLVVLEREAIGTDHGAVGGWLLDNWKLPDYLRLSVAASHSAALAADPEIASFCTPVTFAGYAAEIWSNPQTAAATGFARLKAKEMLVLPPERLERLLGDVAAALPEITSNLDLEIGSEEMLGRLLNEAREALIELNMRAQEQVRVAQDTARRDGLTSLFNRNHLEDALPQYFEDAVRMNHPLSVIFIDIDHFKKVNDTFGHEAGDVAITSVARMLQAAMRASDIVARYGGEEFVCLLANTTEAGAWAVAERIRTAVAGTPHKIGSDVGVALTVSLGCATFSSACPFPNALELLREADRCQYVAKCAGRNISVASKSPLSDAAIVESPVSVS